MTQLVLNLPTRPARGREAFFVSAANAEALAAVDAWRDWPMGRLALVGPASSGKTHLAQVWAIESGARIAPAAELGPEAVPGFLDAPLVLEDLPGPVSGDAAREATLFHLLNAMAEARQPLLLTAREAPARWEVELPDLASRLGAVQVARLHAPDDALLAALLVKLFADRQLAVGPDLLRFLLRRMERSGHEAERIVARLDAGALAEHRPLTVVLARKLLGW